MKADVLAVCWCEAFRCLLTKRQWEKDISINGREAIVAAHQSEMGYKVISKQLKSIILQLQSSHEFQQIQSVIT